MGLDIILCALPHYISHCIKGFIVHLDHRTIIFTKPFIYLSIYIKYLILFRHFYIIKQLSFYKKFKDILAVESIYVARSD